MEYLKFKTRTQVDMNRTIFQFLNDKYVVMGTSMCNISSRL